MGSPPGVARVRRDGRTSTRGRARAADRPRPGAPPAARTTAAGPRAGRPPTRLHGGPSGASTRRAGSAAAASTRSPTVRSPLRKWSRISRREGSARAAYAVTLIYYQMVICWFQPRALRAAPACASPSTACATPSRAFAAPPPASMIEAREGSPSGIASSRACDSAVCRAFCSVWRCQAAGPPPRPRARFAVSLTGFGRRRPTGARSRSRPSHGIRIERPIPACSIRESEGSSCFLKSRYSAYPVFRSSGTLIAVRKNENVQKGLTCQRNRRLRSSASKSDFRPRS